MYQLCVLLLVGYLSLVVFLFFVFIFILVFVFVLFYVFLVMREVFREVVYENLEIFLEFLIFNSNFFAYVV